MCYLCLTHGTTSTSWSKFDHSSAASALSWAEQANAASSHVDSETGQGLYDSYAAMAAGSPLSDAWNWVSGQASSLYDSVYDWASDNVSRAPLGIFSTLASASPYALSGVKFDTKPYLDQDVRALLSGSQWNSSWITYSLPDSRGDYQWINPSANGFKPLSFNTEQAVRYALEGYSPYSGGPKMGLTSVEGVTNLALDYAGRDGATLQIAGFTPNSLINRSHGYYPGVPVYGGDVWLDADSSSPGTYTYKAVLHELGHALGLKHPHDTGGDMPKMSLEHDTPEYTVMSYVSTWDEPQTFMQYDVAALQAMYGADFTTNSGNTVYSWSPQTGETFVNGIGQGAPAVSKIFATIWDGGGIDTYDVSNYNEGATVDLAPGGFVKFSQEQLGYKGAGAYVHGNVYNAFQYNNDPRSLIENAITGNGNDIIRGNDANNMLSGNGGNDTLLGGAGNDTILGGDGNDIVYGGAGADRLDGGAGRNTLSYFDAQGGVTVKLWANSVSGDIAQGDTIAHFQDVSGGAGGDWLEGDSNDNILDGCGGGDLLIGLGGNDLLLGREGNDTLIADWGTDILEGGSGSDLFAIWATTQHAILNDFKHGEDHIQLSTSLFKDFAAIKAGAVQQGDDVLIARSGLDILLKHVQLSSLAASDFQFV